MGVDGGRKVDVNGIEVEFMRMKVKYDFSLSPKVTDFMAYRLVYLNSKTKVFIL